MVKLVSKHLLKVGDLTAAEVRALIGRAAELKAGWKAGQRPRPLLDKAVGLIFEKPSTRTRVSFQVAVGQLGGQPLFLAGRDLQLARSEPLKDTARVLGRYLDALVVRTFGQEVVEELAAFGGIPVVNALSDLYHPCQILADLLTITEHRGDPAGLPHCWLGDGNNMAHCWLEAAGLLGFPLRLACPEGFDPRPEIVAFARERGAEILLTRDPAEAIQGAAVVSTDVWASMGQEEEAAARRKVFAPYGLDRKLLGLAAPDAMVLHCLPAHRGEEISEEVLEGPQSVVWDQAENRLHMQKAILEALAGGR